MPELPEVETTRKGIAPHIEGKTVRQVIVRQEKLRWPISPEISTLLPTQSITNVRRRAKYLLIETPIGTLIIHLGMSGSLRIVDADTPVEKHEHVDIIFNDNTCLRYKDPRRFGCLLWTASPIDQHKLIEHLGPEPLSDAFEIDDFYQKAQRRKTPIKNLIMDGKVVVGVGNIYASEALFMAKIHPAKSAGKISLAKYQILAEKIKQVLSKAITAGGTTLNDFINADGKPGYFAQQLQVYGRKDQACFICSTPIEQMTIGQRSSFYCASCQK